MTDAEIIKALECCSHEAYDCDVCPLNLKEEELCFIEVRKYALDLINRLQETIIMGRYTSPIAIRAQQSWFRQNSEHIKRLNEEIENLKGYVPPVVSLLNAYEIKTAKAEAIKEFAESLCKDRVSNDPIVIAIKAELEMAGDTE